MIEINPKVDIAFKKLFGVEENKDLLISLINSVVSDADQVLDVTLLNPHNPANFKSDKLSILDIKATGHDGKRFNIEIQMTDAGDYDKRALYYWAKLYTEQMSKGSDYNSLHKTIGIHFLNFLSIVDSDRYHNVFHVAEKYEGFNGFADFEIHTVELSKFDKGIGDDLQLLLSMMKKKIDIWAAFLTKYDLLSQQQAFLPEAQYPDLTRALSIMNVMNFSQEERSAYEDHLKWMRDEAGALEKKFNAGKELGRAEGEAIGLEKGEAIGLEKGEAIGLEKGLEKGETIGLEKGEAIGINKIAINLLKKQADVAFIAEATGLSEQDILALNDSLG